MDNRHHMEELKKRLTDKNKLRKEIKKYQGEYALEIQDDNITCVICGGHYLKKARSIHNKSRKHEREFEKMYNYIYNIENDIKKY